MTYILIEADWIVACAEAQVRIEELHRLLEDQPEGTAP